jgi:hypothetical protein
MVPIEFRRFTRLFLQGSHERAKDLPEFIRQAVRLLDPAQKSVVQAYVAELLNSNLDERTLNEIWLSCSPNYWIDEGKVREFFVGIREELNRSSAKRE